MKMEAAHSSETLVWIHQTTGRYVLEASNLRNNDLLNEKRKRNNTREKKE
jgi:hypothetical protein